MSNADEHNVKDSVMAVIASKKIMMRPRWYFVLRAILCLVGIAIVFVCLTFLVSFIMFALRETGIVFTPTFGMHGLWVFFKAAPWMLILLSFVFVGIIHVLGKHYAFSYQRPLLISLGVIVGMTTIIGYAIAHTTMHERLLQAGAPLYRGYVERTVPEVWRGRIEMVNTQGFILNERHAGQIPVMIRPYTRLPRMHTLMVGDRVLVVGPLVDGTCEAFGVRMVQ